MTVKKDRIVITSIALLLFLLPFVFYGNWMLNIAAIMVLGFYCVWHLLVVLMMSGTKLKAEAKRYRLNLIYGVILLLSALLPIQLISYYVHHQVDQFIIAVNEFQQENGKYPYAKDISEAYQKVQMNVPQFIYYRDDYNFAHLEFPDPGMAIDSLRYDFNARDWSCFGHC